MDAHDDKLCMCGWGLDCTCPCERCDGYRQKDIRLRRLRDLEDRLKKANISIEDLADLVFKEVSPHTLQDLRWMQNEPELEAKIDKMVAAAIKKAFKGLQLTSTIDTFSNWKEL